MCDIYCQTQWQAVILTGVSCRKLWMVLLGGKDQPGRALPVFTHTNLPPHFKKAGGSYQYGLSVANWIQISVFPPLIDLVVTGLKDRVWSSVSDLNSFCGSRPVHTELCSGLQPSFTLQPPLGWSNRSFEGHPQKQRLLCCLLLCPKRPEAHSSPATWFSRGEWDLGLGPWAVFSSAPTSATCRIS